jgi:hypothetical protein
MRRFLSVTTLGFLLGMVGFFLTHQAAAQVATTTGQTTGTVRELQQTPAEKAAQTAMWQEFVTLRESHASDAALQDWARKYGVKLDISGTSLLVTRSLATPGGSAPPQGPPAESKACSLKNHCTFTITHRNIRGQIVGGLNETCSYSGCWTDLKTGVVTCFGKITCSYKVGQ